MLKQITEEIRLPRITEMLPLRKIDLRNPFTGEPMELDNLAIHRWLKAKQLGLHERYE